MSKVAESSARSAPARTTSAPPLPPASSASASTTMDLPAPVSPVSTVSPARTSSSMRSMMAKSRICRWVSMSLGLVEAAAAPAKLGAQQAVVLELAGVEQRDLLLGGMHLETIARQQLAERHAIAGDLRAGIGPIDQLHGDDGFR